MFHQNGDGPASACYGIIQRTDDGDTERVPAAFLGGSGKDRKKKEKRQKDGGFDGFQ
jgi:hypothetical protein